MAVLDDRQVQSAVWQAMEQLGTGVIDVDVSLLACDIGKFNPCDLKEWMDNHTSDEICEILL